ncbi:MAG: hypothetical protein LUC26_08055 [Prevotella sp.]|nr:hypothetical protein [Prevotella sp.]
MARKKNEKKWSEMTYEERRACLPEKLNKYGEWLLSNEPPLWDTAAMTPSEKRAFMRAVLK